MHKSSLPNPMVIILAGIMVVLWGSSLFAISILFIKLEDLNKFSGLVSSTNIERGIGRDLNYYVILGLNNDSAKFRVGFVDRLFAEQCVQELLMGKLATVYYKKSLLSKESFDAEVYQLENTHEVLYAFREAKQADKVQAISIVCITIFITAFLGYSILCAKSQNSTV